MSYDWETYKVCIFGSGNWGSAIAKIVGKNVTMIEDFDTEVAWYVYEEIIEDRKLTDIINETHENVKYLPNQIIPENVIAIPDPVEAAKDANILIFVMPRKFIRQLCCALEGRINPNAIGCSLIKGFQSDKSGNIRQYSHLIAEKLKIQTAVVMGAGSAGEVADGNFSETTIGSVDREVGRILQVLIETPHFLTVVSNDADGVEICSALKNIVACGAGFLDALDHGNSTTAILIRLALIEMIDFVDVFFPDTKLSTFFQSCGIVNLISTCFGCQNRRISEAYIRSQKTLVKVEKDLLNGQKLLGAEISEQIYHMIVRTEAEERFPIFFIIHKIFTREAKPEQLLESMRNSHCAHFRFRHNLDW
uniref:Glycerol-3-phosphate dehydrogenase [NAD(+)] n=1 Tax=Graphocephala atropunctata TaxID=36148 RepID=A0A1B6MMT0_9HEMI